MRCIVHFYLSLHFVAIENKNCPLKLWNNLICSFFRSWKTEMKCWIFAFLIANIHELSLVRIRSTYIFFISQDIHYEKGSFCVADIAFTSFNRLHSVYANEYFFEISAKENFQFHRMYSRAMDKANFVIYDQAGGLLDHKSRTEYHDKLRRI